MTSFYSGSKLQQISETNKNLITNFLNAVFRYYHFLLLAPPNVVSYLSPIRGRKISTVNINQIKKDKIMNMEMLNDLYI